MPDPVTVAVVTAAALNTVGKVFGSKSAQKAAREQARREMERARKQAKAEKEQNLYNAYVSKLNEQIQLDNMLKLDKAETSNLQENYNKLNNVLKAQEVATAASGFDLSSGTLSSIEQQSMVENSLDAAAIRDSFSNGRYEFAMKAFQFKSQADNLIESASRYWQGDYSIPRQGSNFGLYLQAIGTGIGTGSLLYNSSSTTPTSITPANNIGNDTIDWG